jgi:hypothetical protein
MLMEIKRDEEAKKKQLKRIDGKKCYLVARSGVSKSERFANHAVPQVLTLHNECTPNWISLSCIEKNLDCSVQGDKIDSCFASPHLLLPLFFAHVP